MLIALLLLSQAKAMQSVTNVLGSCTVASPGLGGL